MNIVDLALAAAFFTGSFDLILVFTVGGTVRFAQLLMLLILLAALLQILQSRRILWSRGASALAIWCGIQGCLITQSVTPLMSLQFFILLIFTILGVFAVLQLYGCSVRIAILMKAYLMSFVFVALFGLFQFVTPALHLGTYLVRQWIRYQQVPRINGFSYEPSFFATYVIMGCIAIIDLKLSNARIVRGRRWKFVIALLVLTLVLSTSKTALLLLILEGLSRLVPIIWKMGRRQAKRFWVGSLVVPLPRPRMAVRILAIVLFGLLGVAALGRVVGLTAYISGTGIGNTAAHSTVTRAEAFEDTWQIIKEHPWIGRSLGGVPGEVAILHGQHVNTQEELRLFWGFPIPFDILAASGVFGFIPFVWFFWSITFGERRLIKRTWSDERAKWLHALIRALIFEWIAFFADQNILRVYFWFHVTMVVIVGYNLRYFKTGRPPMEQLPPAGVPANLTDISRGTPPNPSSCPE